MSTLPNLDVRKHASESDFVANLKYLRPFRGQNKAALRIGLDRLSQGESWAENDSKDRV